MKILQKVFILILLLFHSQAEFIFDFTRILMSNQKVHARVIMTQHAKLFSNALVDNIIKFEQNNGEIETMNK